MDQRIKYSHWRPEKTEIVNGRPVRFRDVCVHEFNVGDVEDPILYAGQALWDWQQSESGQWVMNHAMEPPYWTQHMDALNWGHKFRIMARFSEQQETFWKLKWCTK